jgi:hypothetical protein
VSEEVDKAMRKRFPCSINRSPSLRIQAPKDKPPTLQLSFNKTLTLPIFTGILNMFLILINILNFVLNWYTKISATFNSLNILSKFLVSTFKSTYVYYSKF